VSAEAGNSQGFYAGAEDSGGSSISSDFDFGRDGYRCCRSSLCVAIQTVSGRAHHEPPHRPDHSKATRLQTVDLSYRRGEIVYEKGAPAQFVYRVTAGALFRYKMLPGDGDRRSIIQFLFPGDAFGFETSRRHCDTVEALTDAKVRSVEKEALFEAAAISPRVSKALSSAAFWAARAAEDQSIGLRGRNATEQLALFFLEMDARLSKGGEIDLPMRRQHIADYYGLTIETVSRTINSFRRAKMIEFRDNVKLQRRVVIRDKNELSRLAPDASEFAWWKTR
jgi:CRP/FNR family transcriptional regulator